MTELAAVVVIILMGAAGILSIFQGASDEAALSQPESRPRRNVA
ncbi:MAG TPA: hypothetical protein VN428_23855 [Bryobacteraceae bacterium]|nr:hypothetical protein [Bryobacteraceae bacterium]